MSAYKATSWGRTRRPKAPNNQDGHYVTGSGIQSDGAAAGLPALTQIGAGTNSQGVYKTENQRYMHIVCSGSNSGVSGVYAYTYAAASWSELQHVDLSDGSRSSIVCSADEHIIVDINGADLVSVVTGSSSKLTYQNYIAFSTF